MLSGFILKNEKSAFLDAQSNNVSSAAISFFEQANVSSLTLAVIGEYFNPDMLKSIGFVCNMLGLCANFTYLDVKFAKFLTCDKFTILKSPCINIKDF